MKFYAQMMKHKDLIPKYSSILENVFCEKNIYRTEEDGIYYYTKERNNSLVIFNPDANALNPKYRDDCNKSFEILEKVIIRDNKIRFLLGL